MGGLGKEIHDTVWNVEHLSSQSAGASLFRGIVWIIVIYLGVGAAIMHQKYGARGMDMIPHSAFWCASAKLIFEAMIYAKNLIFDSMDHSTSRASAVQETIPHKGSCDSFGTFEYV